MATAGNRTFGVGDNLNPRSKQSEAAAGTMPLNLLSQKFEKPLWTVIQY